MPNPTMSDVHVDQPLTNISIAFLQDVKKFVANRVFPTVSVAKQSDKYFVYDRGDFYRSEAEFRAPSTEAAGGGWGLTTASYSADVLALRKDIDDAIRANADAPLDMDADAVRYLMQQMLIRRDKDWAAAFFTTSVWTGSTTAGDITPGTLWSVSTSTPIQDVEAQMDSVEGKTGYRPNKLIVGVDVHSKLKNHPDVIDRYKHTQVGIIDEQLLAAVFGVDEYIVARGVENTAAEGATDVFARIFAAKDAAVVYSAPNPSLMQPSAGYIFAWTGYTGAGPDGQRISRYRMDHLRSDRVEAELAYDMKLVSAQLGAFFDNAVA